MTEPSNAFDILLEQIRQIVREEITAALQHGNENPSGKDTLLTPEQAAQLMGVTSRWLYRHAKQLPFCRKLSPKMLRFSEPGLRRWVAAKKP